MKRMRGLVALAGLLALAGCEDDSCPGIGTHPGGQVTVIVTHRISGNCVDPPTSYEIQQAIILGDSRECPERTPAYETAAQCDYSLLVGCLDEFGTYAFNVSAEYIGDIQYEGTTRFARGDLDGNIICQGEYSIRFYNVAE